MSFNNDFLTKKNQLHFYFSLSHQNKYIIIILWPLNFNGIKNWNYYPKPVILNKQRKQIHTKLSNHKKGLLQIIATYTCMWSKYLGLKRNYLKHQFCISTLLHKNSDLELFSKIYYYKLIPQYNSFITHFIS